MNPMQPQQARLLKPSHPITPTTSKLRVESDLQTLFLLLILFLIPIPSSVLHPHSSFLTPRSHLLNQPLQLLVAETCLLMFNPRRAIASDWKEVDLLHVLWCNIGGSLFDPAASCNCQAFMRTSRAFIQEFPSNETEVTANEAFTALAQFIQPLATQSRGHGIDLTGGAGTGFSSSFLSTAQYSARLEPSKTGD